MISTQEGVFEWDVLGDRWAYLTPHSWEMAVFDKKGRRVFANADRILMYEGDPFEKATAPTGDIESQMEPLLKDTDSASWRVRDQATGQLRNLSRKDPDAMRKYLSAKLEGGKLSMEVEARIKAVLSELSPSVSPSGVAPTLDVAQLMWRAKVGNSLLERASSPLAPSFPDGYVIKLGMRFQIAQSVFEAAGAKLSLEIGNQGDHSRQGYVLPDNTMVYLRLGSGALAPGKAPAKIVSIGVGIHGKGYDRDWPWDDEAKNSEKSLELNPNIRTAR